MANAAPGNGANHSRSLIGSCTRGFRRWVRSLRRRWSGHNVRFVYHEAYSHRIPGMPMDDMRAQRVLAFLNGEGLLTPDDIVTPRPPSLRNLLRVHAPEYVESLQERETLERIFGVALADDVAERVLDTQRMMVGGTIQAMRLARHGNCVAVNLGGGLHHAGRDSGTSFCTFNDVAVAVARLRARGFKEPIVIVDLDLHDGNGTRSIFAHDPTVHTYSIHNDNWGDSEAEESTTIELGPDITDELYLGTLLKTLPEVFDSVRPGLVVYVAGTDPAADDTLGNWNITPEGMLTRDRFVFAMCRNRRRPMPMVVVLAGGYGNSSWRYTARFASLLLSGRAIEPPVTEELTLQHFHRLKATLDPSSMTSEGNGFAWSLTEEDLVGIMPGVPTRTRFLGYFSRTGIELVLERFGILDQLRLRGFRHPTVVLDLGQEAGETLRIFSEPNRHELLVELRVNRNVRRVPDHEVLVIEWLLLQNPRAEFGPLRRPLPGQQHPGLGLLREVLGCLVMVCEILDLDGVYYTPSTYHVAAQSRSLVRFLRPQHEARFRAVQAALDGEALSVASRRVADGGLVDDVTGEVVQWEGFPMVMPVTESLKELVFGSAYEAAVAEALTGLRFRPAESPPATGDDQGEES